MNQQEKTFTINVFPCKCATSLITKRKRDKNPFINYKIIPILLKQTQQKILLIRERERKKKSSLSPEKVPTKMEKKYQTFFVTSK